MQASWFVEYKNVRQEPGGRRRWFQSPSGDLMVWYAAAAGPGADRVAGLQFCHAEGAGERVFTWRPGDADWRQHLVETGSRPPLMKGSPILLDAEPVPPDDFRRRMTAALPGLDPDLAAVVRRALDPDGEGP